MFLFRILTSQANVEQEVFKFIMRAVFHPRQPLDRPRDGSQNALTVLSFLFIQEINQKRGLYWQKNEKHLLTSLK